MSDSKEFKPCILIPTYENPDTIHEVVLAVRKHLDQVIVIDDGSSEPGRRAAEALATEGLAEVRHRAENGGKGAALIDGLRFAHELGFSHALQIDADGQHDVSDVPRFLEASRQRPEALILGTPLFDESAPRGRRIARSISVFWVNLETGGSIIADPLCGFRVYPVKQAVSVKPRAHRMGYDPEVAVRLYWTGTPIVNLDTRVSYPEGGVSHYRMFWDNVEMSWTHTRLFNQALPRLLYRWIRWGR